MKVKKNSMVNTNISITEAKKEWSFTCSTDDTIIITGYKGMNPTASVPEYIGNKKVVKIENFAFSPDALYIRFPTWQTRKKLEEIIVPSGIIYQPTIDDIPENLRRISCPDKTIDSIFMPGSKVSGRRCYVQGLYLKNLEEIRSSDNESRYCFEEGMFHNADKTEFYFWLPKVNIKDLLIPNTVKIISGGYYSSEEFGIISIPDSVIEIGPCALYACKAKKLILGGGIAKPSEQIFGGSIISESSMKLSFEEIEFREGITHIPQCFGRMKALKKVVLPESLQFFPDKCFYYRPDIRTFFYDYLERGEPNEMIMSVKKGSYAEKYAKECGYSIEYHT